MKKPSVSFVCRWLFCGAVVVVGSAQQGVAQTTTSLKGLTSAETSAFRAGQTQFGVVLTPAQGLGPIFNGRSCGECHPNGAGSTRKSNIIGLASAAQVSAGGPVIQVSAIAGFRAETVPRNITVAVRRSMTTQGLGLIGGITDQDILAEQLAQQNLAPHLAGKANMVTDAVTGGLRVGRVGQKSQHPNAASFAAEAYLRENGITTPFFPNEEAPFNNQALLTGNPAPRLNDDGGNVAKFANFMNLLAPPASNPPTTTSTKTQVNRGWQVFANSGCADCHKETWTTGSNSVAALNQVTFKAWSDFLLHDMGAAGDQLQQGTDSNGQPIPGSWMRTTPLWGVRLNTSLWHDGSIRQADYASAINKHAGQAINAKLSYQALSSSDKQALVAFLNSL